jgi:hypothetical protein
MNNDSSSFLSYTDFSYSTALTNTIGFEMNNVINPFLFLTNEIQVDEQDMEIAYITDLGSDKFRLLKPFSLLITKENGEYKTEYSPLELYAFGDSKEDVIDEMKDDLLDLCENIFSQNEDNLGRFPKIWKRIIKSIIA